MAAEVTVPAPAELARFTRIIGEEATLALVEAFGGTRVYVSSRARKTGMQSTLQRHIGDEAAARLAAEFAREYLSVPLARNWLCRVYRSRSMSISTIARRLRVTEKAVYEMVR